MEQSNFGFSRWNFQFTIDGKNTLDSKKHHKLLRRIAGRKRLFMDPLVQSGYLKGKRVLDIGCNSGYWSLVALTEGGAEHVTGVDASPELVKQAQFAFGKNGMDDKQYEFVLDDAYHFLSTGEQSFDVILCLGFFYHINDPVRLLSLMSDACKSFVVMDTILHKDKEALISVRPVCKKNIIDKANITLELVSSQKALFWMAEETGFLFGRLLTDDFEKISSMWDYIAGQRSAFIFSKQDNIDKIWTNAVDPQYLSIQEDFEEYGYFPEMHKKDGRAD